MTTNVTRNQVNEMLREAFKMRNHFDDLAWTPTLDAEEVKEMERLRTFYDGKIMGLQHILTAMEG